MQELYAQVNMFCMAFSELLRIDVITAYFCVDKRNQLTNFVSKDIYVTFM